MDPQTIIFLLQLLKPPSPPADVGNISRPSTVDVAALQSSFADLSRGILHCYHPSARYQLADVVQKPWDRQQQYGADGSALIRIQFFGAISNNHYEMTVAVFAKDQPKQIRTAIQTDNAPFPPNPNCQLDRWTGLESPTVAAAGISPEPQTESQQFPASFVVRGLELVVSQEQLGTDGRDSRDQARVTVKRDTGTVIDETFEISGELQRAWVTDLDNDNNPEVILWVRTGGSGGYGEFLLYEVQGDSLVGHGFPELTDTQKNRYGYMGHDTLMTSTSRVIRRFRTYGKNDANCCPSGPTVEITYDYRGKNVNVERIRQIPNR